LPKKLGGSRLVDVLHDTTIVPTSAIQRGAPGTFVYLANADNTVTVRPVTLGPTSGDRVAVLSGLSAGDLVVIDGAHMLRNGARIRAERSERRQHGRRCRVVQRRPSIAQSVQRISAIAPSRADGIATGCATNKICTTRAVGDAYPRLEKRRCMTARDPHRRLLFALRPDPNTDQDYAALPAPKGIASRYSESYRLLLTHPLLQPLAVLNQADDESSARHARFQEA
jgi:hypothetical protein